MNRFHVLREVALDGMRFHALVGILAHERTTPQPIEVDLRVWLQHDAAVLDYRQLYDAVAAVVAPNHTEYLEEIADRVAEAVLSRHTDVQTVRVAVRKPHVALPGPVSHAEVVTGRVRGA